MPQIIAIVLSLAALGLAAAAFFKPAREATPAAPQYSEQEVADAKKSVCGAYDLVSRAARLAGSLTSEDPNQKYMVGINTRLAFNTSADYLSNMLRQHPATPDELSEAVNRSTLAYQEMVLSQTAEDPKPELEPRYAEVDAADEAMKAACK